MDVFQYHPSSKGGVNPPNTSSLRPPAPKGSGRKMTIYTVVGYFLSHEPQSPKTVQTYHSYDDAKNAALAFCHTHGKNVSEVNSHYFSAALSSTSFAEARIYESNP